MEKSFFVKCLVFAALYFSEGLMVSLEFVIIPLFLAEQGINPVIIGLVVGITSIPWVIKMVWGFIIDHFAEHGRKKFIFSGGFLAAVMCFLLALVKAESNLVLFSAVLFLARTGIVFLDVSSDALSIQTTKKRERGRVNGAMFAGQFAGIMVGSSFLSWVANKFSFPHCFVVLGLLIMLVMPVVFIIKEKKLKKKKGVVKELVIQLKKKSSLLLMAYAPFKSVPDGLLGVVLPVFFKTALGLSIFRIGLISTAYSALMAFGSILGGTVSDSVGRKKSLSIFLVLYAFSCSSLFFSKGWGLVALLWVLNGFASGAVASISCALYMDYTKKLVGATEFAVFTGSSNLGSTVGANMSGFLSNAFGNKTTFLLSGVFVLPSIYFLGRLKKQKAGITRASKL